MHPKELQSLIGTLNFVCKVIPTPRPFLQRMVELTRKVSKPHHHIKLRSGFLKDLIRAIYTRKNKTQTFRINGTFRPK